jgi:Fur family transcriptional regulator, ferric uptake regulator
MYIFIVMKKASQLLDELGFRKTEIRLKVLEYLQKVKKTVSQPELEKRFNKLANRVTLYRILSAFEEKGIIHKIIDMQGISRYAMCDENSVVNTFIMTSIYILIAPNAER